MVHRYRGKSGIGYKDALCLSTGTALCASEPPCLAPFHGGSLSVDNCTCEYQLACYIVNQNAFCRSVATPSPSHEAGGCSVH